MEIRKRVSSVEAFRKAVLGGLTFQASHYSDYILYENKQRPELGFIKHYSKKGCYDILLGKYAFPEDLTVEFEHQKTLLRFGIVYSGSTSFQVSNNAARGFSPASFFSVEEKPKGVQYWKRGQQFHGTEIMIHGDYIKEVIFKAYPSECINLDDFAKNTTYLYLSKDLEEIIHQIERLAVMDQLTAMRQDSRVLECMAAISSDQFFVTQNENYKQYERQKIQIGSRYMTLSIQDLEIIRKAHEIIEKEACNPPTIDALSDMLQINSQKLKAGFSHLYHMTIWEFANSVRMSMAAQLLSTTDFNIIEIANQVGYASQASFTGMFKKTYGISPKDFRLKKNSI